MGGAVPTVVLAMGLALAAMERASVCRGSAGVPRVPRADTRGLISGRWYVGPVEQGRGARYLWIPTPATVVVAAMPVAATVVVAPAS